jgi:hypothetical protein
MAGANSLRSAFAASAPVVASGKLAQKPVVVQSTKIRCRRQRFRSPKRARFVPISGAADGDQ